MKKIISIAVILATIFIGYYFVQFLPLRIKENDLYKKMMDCRKMAEERFEKSKKDSDEAWAVGMGYSVDYQVHYNAKLNKCVYCEDEFRSDKLGFQHQYKLVDLYTNTEMDAALYAVQSNLTPDQKQYAEDEKNRFEKYRKEMFEEKL